MPLSDPTKNMHDIVANIELIELPGGIKGAQPELDSFGFYIYGKASRSSTCAVVRFTCR